MEHGKQLNISVMLVMDVEQLIKQKQLKLKFQQELMMDNKFALSGQGEAGRNGGPSGDLYVAFRVLTT